MTAIPFKLQQRHPPLTDDMNVFGQGRRPARVMARTVLEQAFPPDGIDEVFETHRRCQCARELGFSAVVALDQPPRDTARFDQH